MTDSGEPAPEPSPGRLASIDALRGLGALMVLGQHGFFGEPVLLNTLTHGSGPGSLLFALCYPLVQGSRGVTLFLVVSGFCIHFRSARRDPTRNPDFVSFWGRRLWRLYPPFLASIVLALLIRVWAIFLLHPEVPATLSTLGEATRGLFVNGPFARAMAVHLFMVFQFVPTAVLASGNPVYWSLGLEEQLYMLYFMLPWLRRRLGMPRTVLMTLMVTVVWRALFTLGWLDSQVAGVPQVALDYVHAPATALGLDWLTMAPARWFEWMLGAWAVEMALGRSPSRPLYRNLGLAAACAVLGMLTQFSRLGWLVSEQLFGFAFFLLLNRLVLAEQTNPRLSGWLRWLAAVGLFSYSLYLTHYPLVHALNFILGQRLPWDFAYPLGTLLCLPLAWVFYRVFELPAIRRSHRNRNT